MYEAFYNFTEKPFHLSPDPRFFFGSAGHKRVLSYLDYGVLQGEGFIVVTGEVGTGKTTLIYRLLDELAKHQDIIPAHLVTTQLDADNLLSMVTAAFGLAIGGLSKAELLRQFEQFLKDRAKEKKRALLIVDEAQSLTMEGLEVLRMLTNLQLNRKALLQCFLIGQAEFRGMLQSVYLEQLQQRVLASCHLGPMTLDETKQYIEHRLGIVGWQDDPSFTAGVYLSIHDFSGGIPRRINTLCDRILLASYLEETHKITKELVNTVILELSNESISAYREKIEPETTPQIYPQIQQDLTNELSVESGNFQGSSLEQRLLKLEARLGTVEEIITKARDALRAIMARSDRERN